MIWQNDTLFPNSFSLKNDKKQVWIKNLYGLILDYPFQIIQDF